MESKGGLLILSDYYYPGWKVKVNDNDKEVIRAYGVLRGVDIPAGNSKVVFYYEPLSLYTGILISFVSLLVGLFGIKKLKKSKKISTRLY